MEIPFQSVNKLYEKVFSECWDLPALSNYGGDSLSYGDVARKMAELHILYRSCGLQKGDRVALCGKNHANWPVVFLSLLSYGAVPVPLLHEFKSGNIHYLVNHSGSKLLFVDDQIWESLNEAEMPDLEAVVQLGSFKIFCSKDENVKMVRENIDSLMQARYPSGFGPSDMDFHEDQADELAIINYTSGTSGFSKGVMLPYRSIASNLAFAVSVQPEVDRGVDVISVLPCAHMYGLMFEVLYELSRGAHVHFLTRVPSPKIIMQAMGEVKPRLIVFVPLVMEKIYKNVIKPELEKPTVKLLGNIIPGFGGVIRGGVCSKLTKALGDNFTEVIIGGAAFNREIEEFFHKMHFRFTVGYGMTECGPIITYADWRDARVGSSGRQAPNMEVRIDSSDPEHVAGEILCRGANVFLGYYMNDEATAAAFTSDGWFRTGDMGVMDKDGFLYIRGRSKCMILGPSGQNIYPEELETVLNNLPYVVESLVVEDDGALTALIYPDFHKGQQDSLDKEALQKMLEEEVAQANRDFPNYSRISKVEMMPEDFERTPKKSIKRYLYQR